MIVPLQQAIRLIKSGDIVAIPTETVYGLAADAKNISAIQKTFQTKGRPLDNPLIVHISDTSQAMDIARELSDDFYALAKAFWPGPLTMVLNKKNDVPDAVTAGLDTVAIRMPDHPLTLKLIQETCPVTAPSANPSGKPSPTKAQHVLDDFNGSVPVLDGGISEIGLESTVLNLTSLEPQIIRPGAITPEMIEKILHKPVSYSTHSDSVKKSPGTRYSHYKPNAEVQLLPDLPSQFDSKTYYILHSGLKPGSSRNIHTCSGDFTKLARDLYDHFRTADHLGYKKILIESLPNRSNHPLQKALENRILKATTEI